MARSRPGSELTAFIGRLAHGTSEPAYAAAASQFGEQGLVELTTLIGYFVMVSWVMNVAHTPARTQEPSLPAFPQ